MSKCTVVHLPEQFHTNLKAFCREKRIRMSDFAVKALMQAMAEASRPRIVPVSELRRRVV